MIVRADEHGIDAALTALAAGAVVAVPTDTVFGLVVPAASPHQIRRVVDLKARPAGLALPVLCASLAAATELGRMVGPCLELAEAHWPGALTLVVARRPGVDFAIGGDEAQIGLRVPAHRVPLAIAEAAGPLASTSANRHGEAPARTPDEVLAAFGEEVEVIVSGDAASGVSSTVVRCDGSGVPVELLRSGGIEVTIHR